MPNVITIDNGDGTSFVGVTDGSISQEGSGSGATILYTGVGWAMVAGIKPRVRNGFVGGGALGSKILLQNFGGQPATCRFVLLESSGGGSVTLLANGSRTAFSAGQYIDITDGNPPTVTGPQAYVPADFPGTANAVTAAEEALAAAQEDPEA